MTRMQLIFLIVSAAQLGIAVCSQTSLLARAASQQDDRAEGDSSGAAAMTGTPICDVVLSDPICYGSESFVGRRQVLLPNAVPSGLVAHYNFDADLAVDVTGNGNHAETELVHGPSPAGSGHSALFNNNFMMVPDSAWFGMKDFTYSFWVYLQEESVTRHASRSATWCPLLRKGIDDHATKQYASAPGLLFNHKTGQLRAQVTTTIKGVKDGEHVDSNSRLMANRWMHVSMVHHHARKSLILYVNGILDTALSTQGVMVSNHYPLYIGGDPYNQYDCGFTLYIDDVKVYSHAVPPHQLSAEASPSLGGVDSSYVRLGCLSCRVEEAAKRCPKNRHICTSVELHTGGYQVARSLGWLPAGTHVWTQAAVVKAAEAAMGMPTLPPAGLRPADAESSVGLGLCCEGPA